ncbi:cyclic nucleotide-binding domain-containing protein [Epilithonimonas sp.]|uniref:cyclic nucleotide-binding domain-containing protein n=1 Tax=Epilithonimonas sp. TaxID=2894511 RepID=UPI00289E606B|nr:cyclic nucleotide-binding domain-containing protein [Epilithonimonas sp.]
MNTENFIKNEIITPQNSVENYVHFILQGISRVYFNNGDKTYTLDFAFNNNITSSYSSFFTRSPSRFNLEAITNMQVLSLSHHNLEEIPKKPIAASHIATKITEMIFIAIENKEINKNSNRIILRLR